MEKVIEIRNITKVYKNGRGIRDINFDIFKGDVFGFLGPNGAGKSTLMKIILGLSKADKGEVKILGSSVTNNFEQALRKVGCLIETPAVFEYMTAYKNLKTAARFYPNITEQRIGEVLYEVGLEKFKKDKVKDFSMGMKQRLGLALAVLSEPEILILDEPVNGLDIEGIVDIRSLISRLAQEKRTTFFISSHLVHETELVCNRVGIIINGEVISIERIEDLVKDRFESLEQYYMEILRGEDKFNG